jgi:PAS domain S-box-containing protein
MMAGSLSHTKPSPNHHPVKTVPPGLLDPSLVYSDSTGTNEEPQDHIEMFANAFLSIKDSIYITDADNRVVFVNQSFGETYGYEDQDILGKNSTIIWGRRYQGKLLDSILSKSDEYDLDGEFYHRKKDGSEFPVSLSRSVIQDEHGNTIYTVSVVKNITRRKRVEEEQLQAIAQLKEDLDRVRGLSGLLRICCSCKKIKDQEGHWNQIEKFIRDHSGADFTHGICLDCAEKLYPGIYTKKH